MAWPIALRVAQLTVLAGVLGCGDDQVLVFRSLGFELPGPDAGAAPSCDVVEQNCPGTQKCTLIRVQGEFQATCVANGTGALLDPCTRQSLGDDDCRAPGLCTPLTSPRTAAEPPPVYCRRLCDASAQCEPDESCLQLLPDGFGVCVPGCTLFSGECGAGLHCSVAQSTEVPVFSMCIESGVLAEGAACREMTDCGAGLACESTTFTCRLFCSPGQPCPADRRCSPLGFSSLPDLGVCLEP